jgi:coiled-coil domain-containing protein 55
VGFKNVKYGLVKPTELKKNNLFSLEDDEEKRKEKEQRVASKKAQKTERIQKEILEKDPYAFAFDEVLPEIKRNERKSKQKPEENPKPKYVGALLASAEEREKSNNVLYMRKLHKELKEDRELYGEETEKFLTSAYKKQLEENRNYEEKERKLDELEKNNDITKKGQEAFSAFHRNLLERRNVAMGGDEDLENKFNARKKRTKSPEPEEEEERELKERDRRRRNRERAEQAAKEAESIQKSREEAKQKKVSEMQEQYSKHVTDDKAKEEALQRYLERQKMRLLEKQQALQAQQQEQQQNST